MAPVRRTLTTRRPLPPGFGTIWLAVALDLVGFGIVLPILPRYAERFGATPAVAGALVATFSLGQLLFSPVLGRLSDRIGRRPVLVLSLMGTAVGSLVTGLAGSLWVLFAGRIIDGVSGASVSVAQAAVADVASPEERARLLGLLGAAFGIGFVAGPAVGALAALGGPHVPFLVAAALAGANAVVAARRLPETRPTAPRGGEAGSPAATGVREVGDLLVLAFVALVAFSAFEATFALFGQDRLGLTEVSTYAVFAVVGLAIAVVQGGVVHPVVARLGERGALAAGLTLNAAGLALVAATHSWWELAPALGLLTVGQGLAMPALAAALAARAHGGERGRLLGLQQSAGGLARSIGPAAGGLAYQHVGVAAPYLGGALLMGACALAVGRSLRERGATTGVVTRR
jgi:DHA1 family tetracycline resistance protein-like MFS transporter